MSQHIIKKPVLDLSSMNEEIRRRLQLGKIKLLISHVLYFILASAVIFFMI